MTARDASIERLHRTMRVAVPLVIEAVNAESKALGYELRIYEGVRCPSRQRALYAKGRDPAAVDYGRTVTSAGPYQSAHQFGEGADLVFWSLQHQRFMWENEEAPPPWYLLTSEAKAHGLEQLRGKNGGIKEQPHVQVKGFDWRNRPIGPDGDLGWTLWVARLVG